MTTRKEMAEALRARYSSAPVSDRIKILDEFVALTGSLMATQIPPLLATSKSPTLSAA